ncbi:MAG: hypothetical protein QM765_21775 [Myxococcales bacterium]
MNHRWIVPTLAALAFLAAACFPKTGAAPGPLAAQATEIAKARYAEAAPTAEELEKGRQLFLKGCRECHGYPDLAAFPEAKWPKVAKAMAGKAGFNEADAELLTRFVMVAREAALAPAPAPAPAQPSAEPAPAPAAQ